MEQAGIRLNKYLSEAGICSRREADRMIEEGRVTIDGEIASMGTRVLPGQRVIADGILVGEKEEPVLLLVNKPAGVVCTTAEFKNEKNIVDLVHYPRRVYPIGRLDKDSEGLILMTNDGSLVNKILRRGNDHSKEYFVKVNRPVSDAFIDAMRKGVPILDTVTAPCEVYKQGPFEFRIILKQGLNRQIRRMCEHFGYRVTFLRRVRIMDFVLGDIPLGGYREATPEEFKSLRDSLEHSSEKPYAERMKEKKAFEKKSSDSSAPSKGKVIHINRELLGQKKGNKGRERSDG